MQQRVTRMAAFLSVVFAVPVVLSACALGRGTVIARISDQQAKVRLHDNEVAVGDRVALFDVDCEDDEGDLLDDSASYPSCEKGKEIAQGEVIRTLNEHDSVIQLAPDVEFEEGFFVEKQ